MSLGHARPKLTHMPHQLAAQARGREEKSASCRPASRP
jgi:hypothetical protein